MFSFIWRLVFRKYYIRIMRIRQKTFRNVCRIISEWKIITNKINTIIVIIIITEILIGSTQEPMRIICDIGKNVI